MFLDHNWVSGRGVAFKLHQISADDNLRLSAYSLSPTYAPHTLGKIPD